MYSYLRTSLLTYSMVQSASCEANWFAASQKIPRILGNPKVHYRIHKCPPPVPILSQLDPVHTPTSHFLKIHLNIILSSATGSPQWSLSLRFPHQNTVHASPFPHTRHMPSPSHSYNVRIHYNKIMKWLYFTYTCILQFYTTQQGCLTYVNGITIFS